MMHVAIQMRAKREVRSCDAVLNSNDAIYVGSTLAIRV